MTITENYIAKLRELLLSMDIKEIEAIKNLFLAAYEKGNRIFFLGNGGSAANASHFTSDLNSVFPLNHGSHFQVICLSDNLPTIMAIGNDFGFERVFQLQLKKNLLEGDLIVSLSTSGNSKNIIEAVKYAKSKFENVTTISITGFDGGLLKNCSDINILVPIHDTQIAEDFQVIIFHILYKEICHYLGIEKAKKP